MDELISDTLLDQLFEAHGFFDNTIKEMKDLKILYPYEKITMMENKSYQISYNAISKMTEVYNEYNNLVEENDEFFSGERKLFVKYLFVYIFSIIMIKVFSKYLTSDKLSEMWYIILGIAFGTVNANLIYKNINSYRYGTKEKRELMNKLQTLREEYDANFNVANREIDYLHALNNNLILEMFDDNNKVLIKK